MAIYIEWVKYFLIMMILIIYILPVWIEWTLGVGMLISGTLLLLKNKDIISTTNQMQQTKL